MKICNAIQYKVCASMSTLFIFFINFQVDNQKYKCNLIELEGNEPLGHLKYMRTGL